MPTLRWRPFRLPMRRRFEAAHGAMADRRGVLIALRDEDGRIGYGEASPIASLGYGTADDVAALLRQHGEALLHGLADALDPGAPGAQALRCALDVATLDLEAQRAGVPVAERLTEHVAPSVRVNAVIGEGTPEETVQFGMEARGQGYRVLKLKVGSAPLDDDVRRVHALRDAVPDAAIRLDTNGAWDEPTAVAAVRALAPLHVELIEQPVAAGDVEALARVRDAARALGVEAPKIAADEAVTDGRTLERVLDLRAADYVVLKPMFLGGVRPAFAIAERAARLGIGAFATTTFDSSIGTAAALQLACAIGGAIPGGVAHGLGTGEYLERDVIAQPLVAAAGLLALPERPGLGVAPDPVLLDAVAEGDWVTVG
ncbi:MAG: o-succinylbenzoate synthase [Dehalococcoidia bacterium]